MKTSSKTNVVLIILVSTLGYFVDIYDLLLFLIIKNQSLTDIGVAKSSLTEVSMQLLNWQMAGLLLGGFFWGILGDKKGRLSVLFGSILMYSLANFANAFVHDVTTYAILRFVAGVGLAGELGAGITLVSETMSKERRGYGTMLIASIGILGAVGAYFVSSWFNWRIAFGIGAGLGFLLLVLRVNVLESKIFKNVHQSAIVKGDFLSVFRNAHRFKKFMYCVLMAVPIWFVVGILVNYASDFGKALHAKEELNSGKGVMFTYVGIAIGDLLSGLLSQKLKSRKKVVVLFQVLSLLSMLIYLLHEGWTANQFYVLCLLMGIFVGYWVLFVTVSTESFGTNLRATITTITPNLVRGSLIIVTEIFTLLQSQVSKVNSALILAVTLSLLAIFATLSLKETFGKDLNFLEE